MSNNSPRYQPAPGSRLAQTDKELLQLELFMVALINEERKNLSLPMLSNHGLLAAVARAHSGEMKDLGYFEHDSPTAQFREITDRYQLAFGNKPSYLAENISRVSCRTWLGTDDMLETTVRKYLNKPVRPTQEDVERSHRGLMGSQGHRANILSPRPTFVGIGMVHEKGSLWVTQMFSRP